jgi:hypothetical protein
LMVKSGAVISSPSVRFQIARRTTSARHAPRSQSGANSPNPCEGANHQRQRLRPIVCQ